MADGRVECIFEGRQELGEGPVWQPADGRLWWVDIKGPALHAIAPDGSRHQSWAMPGPIGSFAFRAAGGLLVAVGLGLDIFHPENGVFEPRVELETGSGMRMNDGKTDRQGRFWVGSMSIGEKEPCGTLYRYTGGHEATAFRRGIRIPNATAFSPDGRTMYFADTSTGRVEAYDYEPETGEASNPRTFAEQGAAAGYPDGATVDAEGGVWNARYAGGCVARFAPDGRLDRLIELPVSQVTACAFGGPDLDLLFITTAAQNLSADRFANEPLAGGLFRCRPGVRGLPETPFAG